MSHHHTQTQRLRDLPPPGQRTRGQRVAAARLRLGWSQGTLAHDLDLSQALISTIERDAGGGDETIDRVLTYVEGVAREADAPSLPIAERTPEPGPDASYGAILRHARERAGMSQRDLERRLGVTQGRVHSVERRHATHALADWHLPTLASLFGRDTALRLARASVRLSHLSLRVEDDDDPRAPLAAELAVRWDTLTDEQIAALRAVLDDA